MPNLEEPIGNKSFESVMSEIETPASQVELNPDGTPKAPVELNEDGTPKVVAASPTDLNEDGTPKAPVTPAAELNEDGTPKAPATPPAEPVPFVIPEELKAVFPDAESPADIATAYQNVATELKGEQDANAEMVAIFEKEKELIPLLKAVASGKSLIQAIQSLEDIEERLKPPEFEDKEAYDAYQQEQFEKKQTKKAEEAQRAEQQRIAQEASAHAVEQREKFIRGKKMTQDTAKDFLNFIQAHIYGDPKTNKLPEDTFDIFYTAFTHKDEIAKLQTQADKDKAAAELKARNEGIAAAAQAKLRKGDGIPSLAGGAPAPPISDSDRMREEFQTKRVVVETPIK